MSPDVGPPCSHGPANICGRPFPVFPLGPLPPGLTPQLALSDSAAHLRSRLLAHFSSLGKETFPIPFPLFKEGSHNSPAQTLRALCNYFLLRCNVTPAPPSCVCLVVTALKPRPAPLQPLRAVAKSISLGFAAYAQETFSQDTSSSSLKFSFYCLSYLPSFILSVTEVQYVY